MKAIQHALDPAGLQAMHIADLRWLTIAVSGVAAYPGSTNSLAAACRTARRVSRACSCRCADSYRLLTTTG